MTFIPIAETLMTKNIDYIVSVLATGTSNTRLYSCTLGNTAHRAAITGGTTLKKATRNGSTGAFTAESPAITIYPMGVRIFKFDDGTGAGGGLITHPGMNGRLSGQAMTDILIGTTDYTKTVFIPDPASTDGSGKTGLVAANLTVSYTRVETDNDVVVTDVTSSLNDLAALTTAHTDWGILEVSSTLAPGLYRLDIADAVFASGAWSAVVYVMITTSAAAASPIEFDLVAFNKLDGVRLGLTALPNAAADAAGGLPISDAGGLDLDGRLDAAVSSRMATYTQPTGFLAATFPSGTIANTTNITAGTVTTATNVTTVNGLAANVITAASMHTDASAEIADAVWDEDATGHQTTGTFGQAIGDPVADTTTIYGAVVTAAAGATIAADIIAVKAETAAIVADTNELQTDWANDGRLDVILDARASQTSVDTIDGIVDDILVDTAEIGAAGAGLTAINLPDQTMNITGNITGNLSGSVGSVSGAVGSVTGAVGSVTGNVGGTINGLTAVALKDFFDTDSTTTYGSAVAGSVVKEIADNAGGSGLTASDIADEVETRTIAAVTVVNGFAANSITAAALAADAAAEIADAVWDEDATGHQTQGSFGQAIGDPGVDTDTIFGLVNTNLNATVSSRATQTSVDDLPTNAELATALGTADDATLAAIAALNNLSAAQVNAEVDTALADINLDHLVKIAVDTNFATTVHADSVVGQLADNGAGFDRATDSLEAIRDRGDAAWVTATGFSTHSAADVWAVGTRVLTAGTNIVLAKGTGITGFNDLSAAQVNAEADTALADVGVTTTITGRIDAAITTRASQTSVDTIDGIVDDILVDTAEIGAAGAGLTAINLPDQTMNITGNITGNLSGSVGSVSGNVGGTINGLTANALKDFFDTDSTTTYASAVAGSVVKEVADNAAGATITASAIADEVQTRTIAAVTTVNGLAANSVTGAALAADAGTEIGTAVWATTTRLLTAGTNIVLAKGVGVIGFNDLSAAEVNAEADTALADYDGPSHAELVSEVNAVQSDIAALNNLSAAQVNAEVDTALSDVGLTTIITGRIDAAITSRLASGSYTAPDNASVTAIKTKTDQLTFGVANALNVNITYVNQIAIDGAGTSGDPWGPA